MSDSLSYLISLYAGTAGANSPLLDALYGSGSSSSATDPVEALRTAEQTETKQVAATAQQPAAQQAIAQFTKAVQSAKSVDQLLANPAVLNVLLTANGMSDQIGYTALASKVLTSNLSDPDSLANTVTDARWKTLAQTYNFAVNGLVSIQTPKVLAVIANGYAQSLWASSQDSITPGLANALYFKSQASSIASVDQILGDQTLRTVVTTALGVPAQIALQDIGAQEQAIASRLDITKFQDAGFVQSFAERYLIANNSNSSVPPSASGDLTSLAVQARDLLV